MRSEGYSTWVCPSVCLSVCLSVSAKLTSRTSNRAINEYAYSMACERQKICGDFPETTAFKRYAAKHKLKSQYANYSGLPVVSFLRSMHREAPELPSDCQRHSALSKLMPLARVGARTDNTTSPAQKRGAVANFRACALA